MKANIARRKVVVTQRFFDDATIHYLEKSHCSVFIADLPPTKGDNAFSERELVEVLQDADGWIVGHAAVSSSLMTSLPRLKIVARRGVGYERVDLDAIKKTGKVATIAAGGNDACVADHTVGLMLALGHRLRESQAQMQAGQWKILLGTDLYRKNVGIIGLGRIGKAVIQRLRGFDVNILVVTPRPDKSNAISSGIRYVDMDTLLRESDYVTLHAPLTEETREIINADVLARMKSTAFLVNTARGGLVNDRDLLSALRSGQIAGAGLDVFMSEYDPTYEQVTKELISLPNVIASPHSGASTKEGLERTNLIAAQCVVAVLDGAPIPDGCLIADGR